MGGEGIPQLVQRLRAEVAKVEQVVVTQREDLANSCDIGALQGVGGSHAEVQHFDGAIGVVFDGSRRLFDTEVCNVAAIACNSCGVLSKNAGGLAHCVVGLDCAVCPNLKEQTIIVSHLAHSGALDYVVDARDGSIHGVHRDHVVGHCGASLGGFITDAGFNEQFELEWRAVARGLGN